MQAFAGAPAVVSALFDDVDLFVLALSHARDKQSISAARSVVEGETPRIAESVGPDLRKNASAGVCKGIVGRDDILAGVEARGVDAQDFSHVFCHILGITEGISGFGRAAAGVAGIVVVGPASVARADVKHMIGPKNQLAAVMI